MQKEKKPIKRIGWITHYDHAKLAAIENWRELFDLKKYLPQARFEILGKLGIIQRQEIFENITPLVGFEALVKAMTGYAASLAEIEVNVHAMGDGSVDPDDADTELENETARVELASRSFGTGVNKNKAYYTAFYGLTEAIGTFTRMGLFINADPGTPDDGVMWDHSEITITKTGAQSLTIDYEDQFTNDI